ncbi:MAG: HAMP domain-containing sensor histidine kinase [Bacillota bacterium]|nr:HAMP domain-containing sensor histidine kinase [Bacillota bacterium]
MKSYLFLGLILTGGIIFCLLLKLYRIRQQISLIKEVLEDIKAGNLNRRVLTQDKDETQQICYDINEIAENSQTQLIRQKQAEQAYKSLMTGLSHDVKTPLSSLVGYLEAVENGIVSGEEKEEYIHVAFEKAQHLKHFVENLFEWVKLDAGEQIFYFEVCDINELSRNLMADWIPVLESKGFQYEILIPEQEYQMTVDRNSYTRIINNLLQNILMHSQGNEMKFQILEHSQEMKVILEDNGKGISAEQLPHIFERLYQCDNARSGKGNGLGLAITKELVSAHKGTITVESILDKGTKFIISLPQNKITR